MRRRFRGLFGLDPVRDVDAEMAFHLDMRMRELIERGETPERARELTLRRFGDYESSRQACVAIDTRRRRHIMRMDFFTDRLQDVRYALRLFRRAPAFTAIAIVTLALGIGANAAVFSLFHDVLLQQVSVPEPDRLVNLGAPGPKPGPKTCGGLMGDCDAVFSYPMFRDLERLQTVFTGIAAHRNVDLNVGYRGETATATGLYVSGSYFSVVGLRPAIGRLLGADDDRTIGSGEVVVLSHGYWQRVRGGRADVLNQVMFVNGIAMTIVGVAPPGFEGTTPGLKPDVFVPISMRWRVEPWPSSPPENRRGYWIYLFARLKPGVTADQARAAIDPAYRAIVNDVELPLQQAGSLNAEQMERFKAKGIAIAPGAKGQSSMPSELRAPLSLLLGVTALMLLITCLNVANLLLARTLARAREMATRLSAGATRGRLVRQLLTESAVLGTVAAAASLLVASWTLGALRSRVLEDATTGELGTPMLLATAALALVVTMVIGLAPALHGVRSGVFSALKGQAGQPGGGRRAARVRMSLATAQVALSMVLVVLAGLFTKSLANLSHVDSGMNSNGLIEFGISPQRNGYDAARAAALFDRLQDEIGALPGVTSIASSTTPLLVGIERATSAHVEGYSTAADAPRDTLYDEIGEGYFRTLGTPLVAGRELTRADGANAPKVVIVNERFVSAFGLGNGRDALGKRISIDSTALDREIVGVVKDTHHTDLRGTIRPKYFVPYRQSAKPRNVQVFFVRTSLRTDDAIAAIRQVVQRHDPNLPLNVIKTMDEVIREATSQERMMGLLTSAFAALALLVAAVGLYGVLAYTVTQRTPEIGLRMALGASRAAVRAIVLRQVGVMTAIGGAIGLAAAIAIGRAAQSLLFGLQFHDAAVLASAVGVLLLVVFAAAFIPADRAARIDPMRALRCD